ncbi:hypothetical protein RI054_33g130600 [Pseudoscourfieldia marina]
MRSVTDATSARISRWRPGEAVPTTARAMVLRRLRVRLGALAGAPSRPRLAATARSPAFTAPLARVTGTACPRQRHRSPASSAPLYRVTTS